MFSVPILSFLLLVINSPSPCGSTWARSSQPEYISQQLHVATQPSQANMLRHKVTSSPAMSFCQIAVPFLQATHRHEEQEPQ